MARRHVGPQCGFEPQLLLHHLVQHCLYFQIRRLRIVNNKQVKKNKRLFSRYYYTSCRVGWLIDKAIHTHPVQIPFGQTSINCVVVEYGLIEFAYLFR